MQVLDFADGVIQLVGLRAVKDSPLVGQELRTLKEHMPKADARVAAIYRKEGAIFPVGDTVMKMEMKFSLLPLRKIYVKS